MKHDIKQMSAFELASMIRVIAENTGPDQHMIISVAKEKREDGSLSIDCTSLAHTSEVAALAIFRGITKSGDRRLRKILFYAVLSSMKLDLFALVVAGMLLGGLLQRFLGQEVFCG